MDPRDHALVDRLCAISREQSVPLGEAIAWPDARDPDAWYTSPELLSTWQTGLEEGLSEARLRELAFFEAVNFYSLNIHGEKFLLEGLSARLHRKSHARTTRYLHHFLDEENKHLYYFGTFCERYAGRIYPHGFVSFPREYARGEEDLLFFAKVLCFEEVVDHYNRRMGADPRLAVVARQINRLHHLDETRHLAFGRMIVKDLFDRHAPEWSAETLAGVQQALLAFVEAMWRQYYNPEVYRDAGLSDPYDAAEVAWAAPSSRAHRSNATRRCFGFLSDIGALQVAAPGSADALGVAAPGSADANGAGNP